MEILGSKSLVRRLPRSSLLSSGQPFGDAAKRLLDNRSHVASLLSGSRLKEVER